MKKKMEKLFRNIFPKRVKNYKFLKSKFINQNGLEIGGPSFAFTEKGFLPLYSVVGNLDGCNFSNQTVWEGEIKSGLNYKYGVRTGTQFILDGGSLMEIADNSYDFVLSCHSLEHMANPIKALAEWKRIIKDNSYVLLILPHKDNTFDRNRPITHMDHLINDLENNTLENDVTHFQEVLSLHDLSLDTGIKDMEALRLRTSENYDNRCVHHHVFNTPMVAQMVDYAGFKICEIQHFNPFHIIFLLKKPNGNFDNSAFLSPENKAYQKQQFPSDKIW